MPPVSHHYSAPARQYRPARQFHRVFLIIVAASAPLLLALMAFFLSRALPLQAAPDAGTLDVRINAAYNLVVDSNATSPSTYAPSVATVIGEFCNTGDALLTGVQGAIGNWDGSLSASTPGRYPSKDSSTFATTDPLYDSGIYRFEHVGGAIGRSDASRYMGTLAPNECKVQYWHFTYPQCKNVWNGTAWERDLPPCDTIPTWGSSVKADDDLSLDFDVWGAANDGAATVTDNATWTMTMRNEISAMANKIEPNPNGRWFNTEDDIILPGQVITSNGILYELGNINQGFDNNDDGVPDYNAWLQPVGDPAYDPSCFRLIRTSGVLTVSRSAGAPDLYLKFKEQLYFTNLPSNNTGVIGKVFYTFVALNGPCATSLSPYQEVASGFDNEKFNGDFGSGIPPIGSLAPAVTLDKASDPTFVSTGATVSYTIPFANAGTNPAGLTLSSGASTRLVISDTIPAGMEFVTATATLATAGDTVTVLYSTDNGQTWSATLPPTPADVTTVQWWLDDPLPAGSSGNYATLVVRVPGTYTGDNFVENCATISFNAAAPFARACAPTIIQGTLAIGDYVWQDENLDKQQNDDSLVGDGDAGLNDVTVSLYWDRGSLGTLDGDDLLITTTTTALQGGVDGGYFFENLPDGDYLVVVDQDDPDLPPGYRYTTDPVYATTLNGADDLDADFGFGPSLQVDKSIYQTPAYEGQELSYSLSVENLRPGGGTPVGENACRYTVWAGQVNSGADTPPSGTKNSAWIDPGNALGKPDGTGALSNISNNTNQLALSDFSIVPQPGNIQSVTMTVYLEEEAEMVGGDNLEITFYLTDTAQTPTFSYDASTPGSAFSQQPAGTPFTLSEDLGGTWTWSNFADNNTELLLVADKGSGNSHGDLYLDAAAFEITTDAACPEPNPDDVLATVPLVDTYDPALLQFLAAEPAATSVDTANGLISWDNVGPIYPGERSFVQVSFLALELAPQVETDVDNTITVTGATFGDGGLANQGVATETGTIVPTSIISGVLWSEGNGGTTGWTGSTGYESGTDLFIPGVSVVLYRCEGLAEPPNTSNNRTCTDQGNNDPDGTWQAVLTTTTNANGRYLFTSLPDGYYYVEVIPATIAGTPTLSADADENPTYGCQDGTGPCSDSDARWQHPDAELNQMTALSYAGSGDISDLNFGYTVPATVFGTIWEDHDADGSRESGEGGLDNAAAGIVVTLYEAGTSNVVASTQTDANGYYEFTSLSPGDYDIVVSDGTLPSGATWTQTYDPDATCVPTPGGGCDDSHTVSIVAGQLSGSHDFGYHRSGAYSLGDTIFADWDGDGFQDANEEGLSNVTVFLYEDADGDGRIDSGVDALIATTTSGNTGAYSFPNLAAGNYVVLVDERDPDLPGVYEQTADPDEHDWATTTYTTCTICDARGAGTIVASDVLTVDFGYQPVGAGVIGDFVWQDNDGDGRQDPGESGLAGITVWLEVDLDGDGVYRRIMSTTTASGGAYSFRDLPAAAYRVVVDDADPQLPTDRFGGSYQPSTATGKTVTLSTGQTYLDADFGFAPAATVGDIVYWDADGDGQQDWDETGIPNIDVWLCSATPCTQGGAILTATTDSAGNYLFTGLDAITYHVAVNAATLPGTPALTGDPDAYDLPCTQDPTPTECDGEDTVQLTLGQTYLAADFGYRPAGVIGDFVWRDLDRDGIQDAGEPGISGVAITITNGSDSYTTTTDPDGRYSFAKLVPGDWDLEVRIPANLTPTLTNTSALTSGWGSAGILPTAGSSIVTATVTLDGQGDISAINGASCAADCELFVDFGFVSVGDYSLSGTVFYDSGDDGQPYVDGTDLPYKGISVFLYDGNGQIVGSTQTDASGAYTFTNLLDGADYRVAVNRYDPQLSDATLKYEPDEAEDGDCETGSFTNGTTPGCNSFTDVTIGGASITGLDFGYHTPPLADFGDLPDRYAMTNLGDEGARHIIGSIFLGSTVAPDTEGTGLGSMLALSDDNTSDDDEDGIAPDTDWTAGGTGSLEVIVSGGTGYLTAWFDWNNDGDFDDSGERALVDQMLAEGTHTVVVNIPAYANLAETYARFRLYESSTSGAATYKGAATNGEVEDYRWTSAETTPVTLAYFQAIRTGGHVHFEWATATETGNIGFQLYVAQAGNVHLLNEEIILSPVGSSLEPQFYTYTAGQVGGDSFYIEDVDIQGKRTRHGPFAVGQAYGRRPAPQSIDWAAIRQEWSRSSPTVVRTTAQLQAAGAPVARLTVAEDGLYRLSYEAMLSQGIDLTGVAAADIALVNQGAAVPVRVAAAETGFGPGSYVEFYGKGVNTLYTAENVYFLYLDASRALPVAEDATEPAGTSAAYYVETVTLDGNKQYDVAAAGQDPWYLSRLTAASSATSRNFTLAVDNYLPGVLSPTLQVSSWGGTLFPEAPDHHLVVQLAGSTVADVTWDGLISSEVEATVPASAVTNGNNQVTLTLPHDLGVRWDVVGVEAITLSYPRAFVANGDRLAFSARGDSFKVTGLSTPAVAVYRLEDDQAVRMTGFVVEPAGEGYAVTFAGMGTEASYLVTTEQAIMAPAVSSGAPLAEIGSGSTDYLMIAHGDFVDGLAPLVAFHESRGLRVRVVDVQAVYDHYSSGLFDARAIKAYIAHAYQQMGVRYVLLVGGDTYDYRGYRYPDSISFIPSLYQATGPIVRWAPVDPAYADVDGDNRPDLALGRFPVRTPAELSAIIEKTVTYSQREDVNRAIFAADHNYGDYSDGVAAQLPKGWQVNRAYLDQLALADAKQLLLEQLNGGVPVASYFGHSGSTTWSFDGLFDSGDATGLTNQGKPSLVVQFGCWNTYYVAPRYDTLAHQFLVNGEQGAALVLGASTLTDGLAEKALGELLLPHLTDPEIAVGDALLLAKQGMPANRTDILLGYTLLGDPALSAQPAGPTAVQAVSAAGAAATTPLWISLITSLLLMLTAGTMLLRRRHRA